MRSAPGNRRDSSFWPREAQWAWRPLGLQRSLGCRALTARGPSPTLHAAIFDWLPGLPHGLSPCPIDAPASSMVSPACLIGCPARRLPTWPLAGAAGPRAPERPSPSHPSPTPYPAEPLRPPARKSDLVLPPPNALPTGIVRFTGSSASVTPCRGLIGPRALHNSTQSCRRDPAIKTWTISNVHNEHKYYANTIFGSTCRTIALHKHEDRPLIFC